MLTPCKSDRLGFSSCPDQWRSHLKVKPCWERTEIVLAVCKLCCRAQSTVKQRDQLLVILSKVVKRCTNYIYSGERTSGSSVRTNASFFSIGWDGSLQP